jgi:nucleotide-binding universal stress UspA family protein
MKILVAIESSPMAETVMNAIERRLWPSDAVFCVLNIVDSRAVSSDFVDVTAYAQTQMEAALEFVRSQAFRLSDRGLDATAKAIEGYPRTSIIEVARGWSADFIFIGSHRRLSVTDFLLGSVASNVVRSAPCSVEVVRPSRAYDVERVLIAVDGSDNSMAAVRSIAARPWNPETEFKAISVIDRAFHDAAWFFNQEMIEKIDERLTQEARQTAQAAAEILRAAGLKAIWEAMSGNPKTEIIEQARHWSACLIVVGSHGRRLIDRALQGSVAEAVAMQAPCSVEVIRPL